MATNFEPTYYHSSVKAFSHSLDTDPWAVGNLSLRKQSEVKAAEFAYLCAQKHTHTQTRKYSYVVLREPTILKKISASQRPF